MIRLDIDECANPSVCPENSKCINSPGTFKCECNVGYEDPSECRSMYILLNISKKVPKLNMLCYVELFNVTAGLKFC